MNRELARKLLFIVNDKNIMSELEEYLEHRIQWHRDQLEKAVIGFDNPVQKHQGAITELRRFKTLKEEVHKAAI